MRAIILCIILFGCAVDQPREIYTFEGKCLENVPDLFFYPENQEIPEKFHHYLYIEQRLVDVNFDALNESTFNLNLFDGTCYTVEKNRTTIRDGRVSLKADIINVEAWDPYVLFVYGNSSLVTYIHPIPKIHSYGYSIMRKYGDYHLMEVQDPNVFLKD